MPDSSSRTAAPRGDPGGAATLPDEEAPEGKARRHELESGLRGLGAQVDFLVDGTVVVIVPRVESATDQARQVARAALAVKELWPEGEVALATGRGAEHETELVTITRRPYSAAPCV